MLSLGSHVVAVEPAADLARALNETGVLNCWRDRLTVHNSRACVHNEKKCFAPAQCPDCSGCGGWRWGNVNGHPQIKVAHGVNCSAQIGLPESVGGLDFEELVWEAAGPDGMLDLLKMDADGPEGRWMSTLAQMLQGESHSGNSGAGSGSGARRLKVHTIIVEGSYLEPRTMVQFQRVHGYTVLRLDQHDGRRWLTPEGFDAYSPEGTLDRLDRFRDEHARADRARCKYSPPSHFAPMGDNISRLDLEDEWFGVRAMRHVFHVRPNLTEQAWTTILQPAVRCSYPGQYVLTLDSPRKLLPEERSVKLALPSWRDSVEYRHLNARGHG